MKKTQLKAISQLAKRLPASVEIQNYYSLIKGREIPIEELAKERARGNEMEIEEENYYRQNKSKLVEINHYNRIKSAYARNKEQGIIDYVQWLDRHNLKMNRIFEDLKLQQVEKNILKIVAKGAKGFWSNLIQFLLSFIYAFKPQKQV